MKRKIISGITASVMLGLTLCSPTEMLDASAANPFVQTIFSTDPAPLVVGDTLYVYTGSDKPNSDFYYMPDWHCYSTTDMQNWTDHGTILAWDDMSWGEEDSAWAAQCIERNGTYYFYYTLTHRNGGGRCVGVATSDSPTGPFKDALGKPLCGPNWDYIDPTVWIDDDGQAWLMFGNPSCYYVKLNDDMISLDGEVRKFDMNSQTFGPGSGDRASSYGEGPWLYERNDMYYLLYAAFGPGESSESIRYSTAPSPTGPWTYRGVIMETHNCFTNHPGVIDYQGKSYFFYHKVGLEGGGTFNRSVCVEEFEYNADGTIPTLKMTDEGPTQIAPLNPYERVEAETMSWSSGIQTEPIEAGTMAIGYIESGDYVKVSSVDFGEAGASEFYSSVSSDGAGGMIEVHLDSPTGPIIGTCSVPVTGGWQVWETVSCEIRGATGVHDLFLRFSGGESYLFNVDWWQFKRADSTPFLLGDVNSDSALTASDLSLAKSILLNQENDVFRVKAADVNQSGKVTEEDIDWYVQFLSGQATEYPEKAEPEQGGNDNGEGNENGGTDNGKQPAVTPGNFQYTENMTYREAPGHYLSGCNQSGRIIKETYPTSNGQNTLNVYLPYGYDENKMYNIFYLMHGGGENENTIFSDDVNLDLILDHMIMNGELDPLIVVTPTFNKTSAQTFYNEFRESVIPFVEGKYSTYAKSTSAADIAASRMHRAFGGFSMGSCATWAVACHCMDICGYYMPLSGDNWEANDGYGKAKTVADEIDRRGLSKDQYFIFCATGSDDIAYPNMNPQIDEMKKMNSHFVYTSDFSKGNFYYLVANGKTHWWGYVRHYIYDALPSFFHEGQ